MEFFFGTLIKLIRDAITRIKNLTPALSFRETKQSKGEREAKYEGFWWSLLVEFRGLLRVGGSSVNYRTAINAVFYTIYKEGL